MCLKTSRVHGESVSLLPGNKCSDDITCSVLPQKTVIYNPTLEPSFIGLRPALLNIYPNIYNPNPILQYLKKH